ncbi:MAG: hypothetical protein ACK5QY_18820, partial [Pseudanabaena sp.]
IGFNGLSKIAVAPKYKTSLKEMDLSHNNIGDGEITLLVEMIKNYSNLKTFLLEVLAACHF